MQRSCSTHGILHQRNGRTSYGRQDDTREGIRAHQTRVIMPVVASPQDFNEHDLYVDLQSVFGQSLFLKCEGFNLDRKSTRLNSSHANISYAVFCLKKKNQDEVDGQYSQALV